MNIVDLVVSSIKENPDRWTQIIRVLGKKDGDQMNEFKYEWKEGFIALSVGRSFTKTRFVYGSSVILSLYEKWRIWRAYWWWSKRYSGVESCLYSESVSRKDLESALDEYISVSPETAILSPIPSIRNYAQSKVRKG